MGQPGIQTCVASDKLWEDHPAHMQKVKAAIDDRKKKSAHGMALAAGESAEQNGAGKPTGGPQPTIFQAARSKGTVMAMTKVTHSNPLSILTLRAP